MTPAVRNNPDRYFLRNGIETNKIWSSEKRVRTVVRVKRLKLLLELFVKKVRVQVNLFPSIGESKFKPLVTIVGVVRYFNLVSQRNQGTYLLRGVDANKAVPLIDRV